LVEHLCFAAGIVLFQESIHKSSMNACRRNAITADIVSDVIFRNRECHADNSALTHTVGEPIGKPECRGYRGEVEDHTTPLFFHLPDTRKHRVVNTFRVDIEDAAEILLACRVESTDVRDTCAVHQYVDTVVKRNDVTKDLDYPNVVGNVAGKRLGLSTG